MADNDLVINISGNTEQFKAALDELKGHVGGLGEALELITSPAALAVAAVFALFEAGKKAVEAFEEHEDATVRLTQALQNQGIYSVELAEDYRDQAEAIQTLTGIDADAIVMGQAHLQTMIGQTQISKELTQAVVDLAVHEKMDLNSAFDLVGKAMNGHVRGLNAMGLEISATASESERLTQITDQLTQHFGGSAEAMGGTVKGSVQALGVAFSELAKIIGEKLAPAVVAVTHGLTTAMQWVTGHMKSNVAEQNLIVQKGGQEQNAILKKTADDAQKDRTAHDQYRIAAQKAENELIVLELKRASKGQLDLKKQEIETLKKLETTHDKDQIALLKAKHAEILKEEQLFSGAYEQINELMHRKEVEGSNKAFGELSQMQSSQNATLKAIGKAAAIEQIVMKTAQSAMNIYAGFSEIPIVGQILGIAGAAAAIAFGAEQIGQVTAAAQGGLIAGGIPGMDSVPAMLMPGELVVPTKNFEDVVGAEADRRAGNRGSAGGTMNVKVGFDGRMASQVLTVKQNEDKALGVSRRS